MISFRPSGGIGKTRAVNSFPARVFPFRRCAKSVIVSYGQGLRRGRRMPAPLRRLPPAPSSACRSAAKRITPERMHQERFTPSADFVLESGKRPSASALRAGNLVVARVRPVAEALPEPVGRAIVLVDTSASRALGLAAELRAVQALLQGVAARHAAEVPVTVAAFDRRGRRDLRRGREGVRAGRDGPPHGASRARRVERGKGARLGVGRGETNRGEAGRARDRRGRDGRGGRREPAREGGDRPPRRRRGAARRRRGRRAP